MATETAFEEPKESFTKLLLEMQSKDLAVIKWQQKAIAEHCRNASTSTASWRIDHRGLLHYNGAV
jgi:hypothetical protein